MKKVSQEKEAQVLALLADHSRREAALLAGISVSTVSRIMRSQQTDSDNPLAAYTPRQLMQELRRRGYTGELQYVQKIDLANI